ncbi:hypothetical protein IKE98_02060 [Candidatus Saccharibacteria bacterium]|nr:hypothetical protein [Candidatus Saccharibacteria bacterium]
MGYVILFDIDIEEEEDMDYFVPFIKHTSNYGFVSVVSTDRIEAVRTIKNRVVVLLDGFCFSCFSIVKAAKRVAETASLLEEAYHHYDIILDDDDWYKEDQGGWEDEYREREFRLSMFHERYTRTLKEFLNALKENPG